MIDYDAVALGDPRSDLILRDLESARWPAVLVGAWMTRIWLVAERRPEAIRRTNDIDVALVPEVPATTDLLERLATLGYKRDTEGYSFRHQRMSEQGLLIVDLLTDADRPQHPDALPVVGLGLAIQETVPFSLRSQGGDMHVRVPTLDRAVLLRALALLGGPETIKFPDYARDYAALASALADRDPHSFRRLSSAVEYMRARSVLRPLFAGLDSPGARAVAEGARGDPDLAARNSVRVTGELFGG